MDKDVAISVKDVYKSFKIPHEKQNSLKSSIINIFKKKKFTQYNAAKGISFDVKRGEFLGIVGRNGCGKSTMLKMLAGIYRPDRGAIEVDGRLSPFLELGVGFNPELSARDNVYLNGTMLGLSKKEISEKFDEIIAFAELEEFVDQKLKNFSSGMQVRLAFSVAIQAHADILLIDEVLAVGDANFQAKCQNIFHRLKREGKTIVFVTHSMGAVKEFCDRVILFKDGEIYKEGFPKDVVGEYEKINFEEDKSNLGETFWGNGLLELEDIAVAVDAKNIEINFNILNNSQEDINTTITLEIFRGDGISCFGSVSPKEYLARSQKQNHVKVIFNNNLGYGEYYIDYRLSDLSGDIVYKACSYAKYFKNNRKQLSPSIVYAESDWK